MTAEEMDNMFDVLYNNITSNQAPGLNAYEKSIFLTKAQDEIIKNHFSANSKGNALQQGFDDNQKRQIDFSMLIAVSTTPSTDVSSTKSSSSIIDDDTTLIDSSSFSAALFDGRSNSKSVPLPTNIMMSINEMVEVKRNDNTVILQVVPIKFDEYSRLMSKPFKRPLKYQAWRLINSNSANKADIIIGPGDSLKKHTIRYIKRPSPIIVSNLDGLTIDNKTDKNDCELDPILHQEIVQRAVELAKTAWLSTDANSYQLQAASGLRSE